MLRDEDHEEPSNVADEAWPAPDPGERRPRAWKTWHTWLTVAVVLVSVLVIASFAIELPYYTIEPGDAINLYPRVSIDGGTDYPTDGEMLLLFVTQRSRVNVWDWVRASLDDDVDLVKEERITGGRSPDEVRVEAQLDMARAQYNAKRVALEASGYQIPAADGAYVLGVYPGFPAGDVLEPGDVIHEVGGEPVHTLDDLVAAIQAHDKGDMVPVRFTRDDEEQTVPIEVAADDTGRRLLGIAVVPNAPLPVDITIDTSNIGGPSAGLAMTLSIVDKLTPGDLNGGLDVAVTGTIDEEGNVGEIGGIRQKAVAARHAGAELFLVPQCADLSPQSACSRDLAQAKQRAGDDIDVVPVGTLDDALAALEAAGGEPLVTSTTTVAPDSQTSQD
jgi:PDZ domain-containing protein